MKCWNSTFNAQGWKGVIVCTFISSENICSNNGGILGKKKNRVKLTKPSNRWFFKFHPPLNVNVFFCKFFFNLTLFMTKFKLLVLSFPNFMHTSNEQELKHYAWTNAWWIERWEGETKIIVCQNL